MKRVVDSSLVNHHHFENPLSYYLIRVCAQPATTCLLAYPNTLEHWGDFRLFFAQLLLNSIQSGATAAGGSPKSRRRHTRSRSNGLTAPPQKCALFWGCCCCSYCQPGPDGGTANPFLAIRRAVQCRSTGVLRRWMKVERLFASLLRRRRLWCNKLYSRFSHQKNVIRECTADCVDSHERSKEIE